MDSLALKSCTESFTRVVRIAAGTINPKLYLRQSKKRLLMKTLQFAEQQAAKTNNIIKSCCLLTLKTFEQKYFAFAFVTQRCLFLFGVTNEWSKVADKQRIVFYSSTLVGWVIWNWVAWSWENSYALYRSRIWPPFLLNSKTPNAYDYVISLLKAQKSLVKLCLQFIFDPLNK